MTSSRTGMFLLSALLSAGAALAGFAASPAAAQQRSESEDPWHPEWGDWSVAFHLPEGGGAGFGFWKQAGENLALGVTLDGRVSLRRRDTPTGEEEATAIRGRIGPVLKRYWWTGGPVSPFFHAGLDAMYDRLQSAGPSEWRLGAGLSLGLGADWFPAEGLSIGGHTGVRGSYSWVTNDDDVRNDVTDVDVRLFTSALSLHLYF